MAQALKVPVQMLLLYSMRFIHLWYDTLSRYIAPNLGMLDIQFIHATQTLFKTRS